VAFDGTGATGGIIGCYIYRNNVTPVAARDLEFFTATLTTVTIACSNIVNLNVNDVIDLRYNHTTGFTMTMLATDSFLAMTSYKTEPLTIDSSVYMPKYYKKLLTTATTFTANVAKKIPFDTLDLVSPSSTWMTSNGGDFNILEAGIYQVYANIIYNSGLGSSVGRYVELYLHKNGATLSLLDSEFMSATSNVALSAAGSNILEFEVEDTISLFAMQSAGPTTAPSGDRPYIIFTKLN
jgi:hypothetical protein